MIFAMSLELNSLLPSPGRGDPPLFLEVLLLHGHSLGNLLSIMISKIEASDFEYS